MTVYAPSDVRSINVPHGCGQSHEAGDLAPGEHFKLDCPTCEPLIIAMRTGWAHTLEGVHMTPDEIALVQAEEAAAARERNRTWGSPTAIGNALAAALSAQAQGVVKTPTLVEQIAALSDDERAALIGMLAAPSTGGGNGKQKATT